MGGSGSGKKPKKKARVEESSTQVVVDGAKGKARRTRKHLADPAAGQVEPRLEDILAEAHFSGIRKWHIKWAGFGVEHATWEPIENLAGCEDFLVVSRM